MVAPIVSGPDKLTYVKSLPGGFYTVDYTRKKKTTQKSPYTLRLPYVFEKGNISGDLEGNFLGSPTGADSLCNLYYNSSIMDRNFNKSYEKLKGGLYDNVSAGVDFAEARQSINMIAGRAGQLLRFGRKLKTFDVVGAAREIGLAVKPKGVSAHKSMANNWLEYHFGWKPLVKDIYDGLEVLNNPTKKMVVKRGASSEDVTTRYNQNAGSVIRIGTVQSKYTAVQGAFVSQIQNGTLHTLDQWGLLNPAVIAWELVPFSFVVDWFSNVGQVLASYSDFAGMTLGGTYSTLVYRNTWTGSVVYAPGYSGTSRPRVNSGKSVVMQRVNTLTSPVFSVKKLRPPSKERAATAISLLTQFLRR